MTAALLAEATLLPHWIPMRWIPQISFLILLYSALKDGARAGMLLGVLLGIEQALFSALPPGSMLWIYAALGGAAGMAKRFIFLESPLAQWLAPVGFGLLVQWVFFLMMPWDDTPLGLADFTAMLRTSNFPVTWLLSGAVYAWCERRLFFQKKS